MTSGIICPFCMGSNIRYSGGGDSVEWSSEESGIVTTDGLFCEDESCPGSKGFSVVAGFVVDYDDATYYDDEGNEIDI